MKILKIFGIVVGVHIFALVLIFANPGCSSTNKPTPVPADTVQTEPAPQINVPMGNASGGGYYTSGAPYTPADSPAPVTFDPDAPAVAAPVASQADARYRPTRPNTHVAEALVREPVSDVLPATTYVVKSGDNLWTIARRNKITVAELRAANGLSANSVLRPGQKLLIPGAAAAAAASQSGPVVKAPLPKPQKSSPAPARASGDSMKHVVQSGETLGEIARKYGVRQADLAVANNIADPGKIQAGTELVIPGWQTPAARGGKSVSANEDVSQPISAPNEQAAAQPDTPAPANEPPPVPVIRIDESPIAPAPRP